MEIPNYLPDEIAETIGRQIAQDFNLKKSREHPDRWETESGTFTSIGIARRAHFFIVNGLKSLGA